MSTNPATKRLGKSLDEVGISSLKELKKFDDHAKAEAREYVKEINGRKNSKSYDFSSEEGILKAIQRELGSPFLSFLKGYLFYFAKSSERLDYMYYFKEKHPLTCKIFMFFDLLTYVFGLVFFIFVASFLMARLLGIPVSYGCWDACFIK